MSLLLFLLAIAQSRKLVSKTFPVGASTFQFKAGVQKIESMTGKGGVGTPAYPGEFYYDIRQVIYGYTQGGAQYVVSDTTNYGGEGAAPSDYCVGPSSFPDVCYYFIQHVTPPAPAGIGPSTTAFGQVFVGGTGGPASSRTTTNIAVNAATVYQINVAAGGSLSITYYE